MTNPYEIITESNMNAPTARLLNKQVNCKRKLVIYNGENMVG